MEVVDAAAEAVGHQPAGACHLAVFKSLHCEAHHQGIVAPCEVGRKAGEGAIERGGAVTVEVEAAPACREGG